LAQEYKVTCPRPNMEPWHIQPQEPINKNKRPKLQKNKKKIQIENPLKCFIEVLWEFL